MTRKKEPFEPLHPPAVTWYNCGPTVYDHFHIGNARNFVVFDTVRRYLEYRGYQVRFAQNLTDIDDKIIRRANERNVPASEIAERYSQSYFLNAERLNVRRASVHPKATQSIPQVVTFIQGLIDKGYAYEADGSVYFRIGRFAEYGRLSGNRLDELKEGARVELDPNKESPLDFDLWKAAKPGEPSWDSPWSAGRPGWHIECSTMCLHHLGETIDIHSGGADLVFPHHENEIAQSEALTGKPFARYWLHNGFLTIRSDSGDEEKMSKSLGNDMKIDAVLEKFDALAVRAFLLSAHYRSPLVYSFQALAEMESAIGRLRDGFDTARQLLKISGGARPEQDRDPAASEQARALLAEFETGMDDDFNTARALAAINRLVTEIHEVRQRQKGASHLDAAQLDSLAALLAVGETMAGILGLDQLVAAEAEFGADNHLTEQLLDLLIDVRSRARKAKAFELADAVRKGLDELGFVIEDHSQGTVWKKK